MIPHHQHERLDLETDDMSLMSRRALLRRSMLGIAGAGVASLLVACGGDEEDEDVQPPDADVPDVPDVEDVQDVDPDEPALSGTDDEEDPDDEGEESD